MPFTCIDTNTNCAPHVAALKARGVKVIARYFASSSWKRMTAPEVKTLSDAGFQLVSVFEDSGKPPLTMQYGEHDAQIALAQADQVGQPHGTAIYFALEGLPSGYSASHLPGLKLYFQGVNNVLAGRYQIGAYSNGLTLAALLDAGLIQYAWLSASMGFTGSKEFSKTNRWNLWQRLPIDQNWDGVSVDINDTQGDFGAWSLNPTSVSVAEKYQAGGIGGAIAAVAPAPVVQPSAPVPVVASSVAETPSLWARFWGWIDTFDFRRLDKLQDMGSRSAGAANLGKKVLIRGGGTAVTVAAGAATLIDPSKGTAELGVSWASQHPVLLLLLGISVTALIVGGVGYYFLRRAGQGVLSAHDDGRYAPRGAA